MRTRTHKHTHTRWKDIFKQEHPNDNRYMKKMFNFTNQGNLNQSHKVVTFHIWQWLSSRKQEITSVGQDVKKREPLDTNGGKENWYNCSGKHNGGYSKTIKCSYHKIQQSYFRISIDKCLSKTENRISKRYMPCLLQHYSQLPQGGNNLSVFKGWMDKEDVYTWIWNTVQQREIKKSCHVITWMDIEGMTLVT